MNQCTFYSSNSHIYINILKTFFLFSGGGQGGFSGGNGGGFSGRLGIGIGSNTGNVEKSFIFGRFPQDLQR